MDVEVAIPEQRLVEFALFIGLSALDELHGGFSGESALAFAGVDEAVVAFQDKVEDCDAGRGEEQSREERAFVVFRVEDPRKHVAETR